MMKQYKLDMGVFQDESIDVKMPNGDKLNITKPTQELFMELMKYNNLDMEKTTDDEMFKIVDDIVIKILNNNATFKKITKNSVKDISFANKLTLLKMYTEFITEILSVKN